MNPVEQMLERLEGVKESNGSWVALCPAHDDREPSLSVAEGDDGRALLKCFAGCDTESIVKALGLTMADLFEQRNGVRREFVSTPPKPHATAQPCNLENYARLKGLPVDWLKKQGLSDRRHQYGPAIRMVYHAPDGSEAAVRFRTALEKAEDGPDNRFRWRSGSKVMLYGLERLEKIKEAGYVVLVEGESDAHTLWYHRIPALGIPGVETWKDRWADYLEGVDKVYAVIEPDKGGETLREKLVASNVRDRLHLVSLGEHKDPSSLYLADPESFEEIFRAALDTASPWEKQERQRIDAEWRRAWEQCRDLALAPNILERFVDDLRRCGVVGEERTAQIIYLAINSRFLDRPVSIVIKGPSSGGKNYLTEQVLRFFPGSAYYALTAMSERALAYGDEPLSHRILVIYEAAGMNSGFQTYLIRSLMSEGRLRYETVEKTAEGLKPRLIEREGPTGLILTTTAVKLHPENETRMLSLSVTDTQEQTRNVILSLAEEEEGSAPDLEPWRALQTWLVNAEHRITIPYAQALAKLIPAVAVRLRRDFGTILALIRSHAVLHQATRERDSKGRIVATLEDYAVVRELVADLVSEGVEAAVPTTIRETVETLNQLRREGPPSVTVAKLAKELDLDKSSMWRRVRAAIDRGYLRNLEVARGRPARLVPGDPLPEDVEILPAPKRLHGCA